MKNRFIKYFIILSIFMLFGAIAEWPYGYLVIGTDTHFLK